MAEELKVNPVAEAPDPNAPKKYVVKQSGVLVQAGVPMKAGMEIMLDAEEYEKFLGLGYIYASDEGEQAKAELAQAKAQRRQERQQQSAARSHPPRTGQGTVVVESATKTPAEVPTPPDTAVRTR